MWESIKDGFQSIIDFLYQIVLSVFDFLKDFLWWVLDNLMYAAISLLDLTGEGFAALNPLQYINAIPDETKGMLAMIGFNEVMSIIIAAIIIRFILQLIPFVRWGS
jgi:hypothetical protein